MDAGSSVPVFSGSRIIAWNTTTDAFRVKNTEVRAVVGLVCTLSIIGSLMIIFSYVCFKKRRTRAREILVNISLMDLGVALANVLGIAVNFDRYYYPNPINVEPYIDNLCKTQAFFAAYTTLSSVYWTIGLMAYLYFLIIHSGEKTAFYFLRFCYVFSYGMPLLISVWLLCTGKLGYSPYDSSGWCSLISKDPMTGQANVFVTVFGNDLWIYLAILLIPLLYISIRLFIVTKVKVSKNYSAGNQLLAALHNVDYKFLLVPIIFINLRLWTCIANSIYIYGDVSISRLPSWFNNSLMYLTGIGDSGQGFANAILFVIFSKAVRQSFLRCITCKKDPVTQTDNDPDQPTSPGQQGKRYEQLEPSAASKSSSASLEDSELGSLKENSTHFFTGYGTIN